MYPTLKEAAVPFQITVEGPKGSGKTAVLTIIMDALGERGLLDNDMTVLTALSAKQALEASKTQDFDNFESMIVQLKTPELVEEMLSASRPICADQLADLMGVELPADDGIGLGLVIGVDADEVAKFGWAETINEEITHLVERTTFPAGTDEVSIIVTTR